jgi:solute carrier family 41
MSSSLSTPPTSPTQDEIDVKETDDSKFLNTSASTEGTSTTTISYTIKTASKKRAAWILKKLKQGTADFLSPNWRTSQEYTKVERDDEDNDNGEGSNSASIEMANLEDVDLDEYDSSEDANLGISAALDLPAPWKIESPTRPSNASNSNTASSSSSSSKFGVRDGMQIVPTLLLASVALAITGSVLDQAQHWIVFQTRTAYFVAMPMLFGIKGNLDMTLASRLTSALHSGELSDKPVVDSNADTSSAESKSFARSKRLQIYQSSLALLQVQAIICGFVAGIFTLLMTQVIPSFEDVMIIIASIVVTTMIAAFVFGLLTFGLVLGGHHVGCDPDNIATPIVSSLGDLGSLILLASVATLMDWFSVWGGLSYAAPAVLLLCAFAALPFLWCVAAKDKACAQALKTGWVPILIALVISQFAGMALETSIVSYQGVGIFVLFINGFGGNMGCIYASRICSILHASNGNQFELLCPISGFLLMTSCVVEIIWLIIVALFELGHVDISFQFSSLYLIATIIQVCLLLMFVRIVAPMLYAIQIDPDNFMTPSLTALGDLVGTFILWAVFIISEDKIMVVSNATSVG